MKKWLAGKKFISNMEIITEVNAYFEGLGKLYYTKDIKELEYCWSKCIELEKRIMLKNKKSFIKNRMFSFSSLLLSNPAS